MPWSSRLECVIKGQRGVAAQAENMPGAVDLQHANHRLRVLQGIFRVFCSPVKVIANELSIASTPIPTYKHYM